MTPGADDAVRPTYRQAAAVLSAVNFSTRYRSDPDLYGKAEFWAVAAGEGDCEDFALAYRQQLLRAGVSPDALRLALCRADGQMHCVLLVTTIDAGTVVLDCRHAAPLHRWQLGYEWIAMQEGQAWATVKN